MRIFVTILFTLGSAWNKEIHGIIANIASKQLSDSSLSYLSSFLGPSVAEGLIRMAGWADDQPESDPYHFTHTPYRACAPYNKETDCRNGECLVTGIEKHWKIFVDQKASFTLRMDALKYIIHFIGDSTQPLHTGFFEDAGGTMISIADGLSLHEYWDFKLFEAYKETRRISDRDSLQFMSEFLLSKAGPDKKAEFSIPHDLISGGNVEAIGAFLVSDTATKVTCALAYQSAKDNWIETGHSLIGSPYMVTRSATLLNQILKAGIRLGQVLNTMISEYRVGRREIAQLERAMRPNVQAPKEPSSKIQSTNIYHVLFEFDPEEHLFENEEEMLGPIITVGKAKPTSAHPKQSSKEEDMAAIGKFKSEYEAKLFEGVDLDGLVLVKRKGRYYITYRASAALIGKGDGQFSLIVVNIRFGTNQLNPPTLFCIDHNLVPAETRRPSLALVTAMIQTLKGDVVNYESAKSSGAGLDPVSSIDFPYPLSWARQFAEEISPGLMEATRRKSVESAELIKVDSSPEAKEKAFKALLKQEKRLISIPAGKFWLISNYDLLVDDMSIEKLRVNVVPLVGDSKTSYDGRFLMIDTRVYGLEIDNAVTGVIGRICNLERTVRLSNQFMERNRKVPMALLEMHQLSDIGSPSWLSQDIDSRNRAYKDFSSVGTNSNKVVYSEIHFNPGYIPNTGRAAFKQVSKSSLERK
jgi:hypothetical protein